jgi:hypothetical protein
MGSCKCSHNCRTVRGICTTLSPNLISCVALSLCSYTKPRIAGRLLLYCCQVSHIANRCLVEHAPSPQRCATLGGVWDDTEAATDKETGGKCLSPSRAEGRLEELGSTAEVIEVELSHDQQSECWLLFVECWPWCACLCACKWVLCRAGHVAAYICWDASCAASSSRYDGACAVVVACMRSTPQKPCMHLSIA